MQEILKCFLKCKYAKNEEPYCNLPYKKKGSILTLYLHVTTSRYRHVGENCSTSHSHFCNLFPVVRIVVMYSLRKKSELLALTWVSRNHCIRSLEATRAVIRLGGLNICLCISLMLIKFPVD